jgi:ATP-binding cassette subfamily F protein 3
MNLRFIDIAKSYDGKKVLEQISGAITPGDKIGLVGRNGVGKTTLVKILAGQETCDAGKIDYAPITGKIVYLEQYPQFVATDSVYEAVLRVAENNCQLQLQDVETMVKKSLHIMGIAEERWEQRALSLSGGEKTKLALCRVWVSDYDLLILDEPTNHLDLVSCEWLENFVANLAQPMVIISHDRYFLDQVTTKIWELTTEGLKEYAGNYSGYRRQKEIEEQSIAKEYQKQQLKIRHLKQVISERRGWYKNAHTAAGQNDFYRSKAKKHAKAVKAKERELERVEKEQIAKPQKAPTPAFAIINKNITGKKFPPVLVRGEKVGKSFGEKVLFQGASFAIERGDKIALLGANGAGKTTLLKIIAGLDQSYSGEVTISPSVNIGYFAQELDNLDLEATILDHVLTVGASVEEARLLLACLLFRGDAVDKKIGCLSMGERGRVAFAKLILAGANLLILDEPTNYMDIESKEKIEEVITDFNGSLIFVTHDRYFMRLATKVFVLTSGKLNCYAGNYAYYLTKRKDTTAAEQDLTDNIIRLECELAFLGGKLNAVEDEAEKEELQARFLKVARELRHCKDRKKRK